MGDPEDVLYLSLFLTHRVYLLRKYKWGDELGDTSNN